MLEVESKPPAFLISVNENCQETNSMTVETLVTGTTKVTIRAATILKAKNQEDSSSSRRRSSSGSSSRSRSRRRSRSRNQQSHQKQ